MNSPITETAIFARPYDARITGATVVPDPAVTGSTVAFKISVQNIGTNNMATASVQLKIYKPDGTLFASKSNSITNFVPGTTRTLQMSWTVPSSGPAGAWTYNVYVYYATTLLDQKIGQGFTVQAPIITGDIVSVTDSPDPALHSTTATFTVKIKNTGNIVWSSAKITVKIYKPDGTLSTTRSLTVTNIQPGVEYSYRISWAIPGAPRGTYTYDAQLYYGTTLLDSHTGMTIVVW